MHQIRNNDDDNCSKFAVGFLNDYSQYLESRVKGVQDDIIPVLLEVLQSEKHTIMTKLSAIQALGDLCMFSEDRFVPYMEECMKSLFSAAEMTAGDVSNIPEEEQDIIIQMRQKIIEAFIAMLYGFQVMHEYDQRNQEKILKYVDSIYLYMNALVELNDYSYDEATLKSFLELFTDLVSLFGEHFSQQWRTTKTPHILK